MVTMMRYITITISLLVLFLIQGCTTGELRAFNDAMSESSGYTVTYPDQVDTEYVGDIVWTTGVEYGEGYQEIYNSGDTFCKVRVEYEDDDYDIFNLDPGEGTGSMYMSLYNQSTYITTMCNTTSDVFYESFDD